MKIERLGNICKFQGGTQPPKEEWVNSPRNGYVRMLQIRDFTQGKSQHIEYVKLSNKLNTCKEEDILIGRYGASIGKILKGLSGAYNVAIIKTIPEEKYLSKSYLYQVLKSVSFQNFIKNIGGRAAQAGFNKEEIENFKIYLPALEDQIKIATILGKVEALITQRKESIDLLDVFLKSTFIKSFIDIEYPFAKLESITTKITDGEHKKPDYKEVGKPFISVVNISKGFLNFENCKFVSKEDHLKFNRRCNPEFEDIIYTKVGATYGRAVIVNVTAPFSLYVSVALIKPDRRKVNPYFLKSAINHPFVKRQADKSIKGAGVPDLHLIEIKSFKIPLPPMELQVEFADLVAKVEILKAQLQSSSKGLENLFGSLSQKAFKGELDLSSMDKTTQTKDITTNKEIEFLPPLVPILTINET